MENKLAQLCPHPGPSSATALITEVDLPGLVQAGVCQSQSKALPRWEWNNILANPAELNPPPLVPLPQIPAGLDAPSAAAQWLVLVTVTNPAQCSQGASVQEGEDAGVKPLF